MGQEKAATNLSISPNLNSIQRFIKDGEENERRI